MKIRKKITITLKEYFLFNVGLIKKTLITYVIALIPVVILFNGITNGFNLNQLKFWLDTVLFYAIGLVVLLTYYLLLVYFASKKAYLPNKKYYENIDMMIDEEGIHQYGDGAESHITYDKIYQLKETRSTLIILLSPRQGMILPKKGFNNEEILEIKKLIKK